MRIGAMRMKNGYYYKIKNSAKIQDVIDYIPEPPMTPKKVDVAYIEEMLSGFETEDICLNKTGALTIVR